MFILNGIQLHLIFIIVESNNKYVIRSAAYYFLMKIIFIPVGVLDFLRLYVCSHIDYCPFCCG